MRFTRLLLLMIALSFMAACSLGGAKADEGHLLYNAPTQKTVPVGEFLPGTGVQYVRSTEEKGAELLIDGERAYKKVADSVDWGGSPVDGVNMDLSLRILHYNEEELMLGGTVKIDIADVNPQPLGSLPDTPVHYAIPVTYEVKVGDTIPGTQLHIASIDEEKGVELSGFAESQYRFRKVADSIQWQGSLRPAVALKLDVRVVWIRNNKVQLAGIADVLMMP